MRHKKKGSPLNRTQGHRRALVSNMVTSLIDKERIRTTKAKAREIRPVAEKMITFAKRGDLHARRQALRIIKDKDVVAKLFTVIAERFKQRPGGYTRILKLDNRLGDNAPMAILELLPEEMKRRAGSRKRRSKKTRSEAPDAQPQVQKQEAAEVAAEEPQAPEVAVVEEAPVEVEAAAEMAVEEAPVEEKAEAAAEEAVADAPVEEEKAEAPAEEAKSEEEEKKE